MIILILNLLPFLPTFWAIKSCSSQHDFVEVCTVQELYFPPLPVQIDTEVYLNDIHGINDVEKSISIFLELETFWIDEGISVSGNDSSAESMVKHNDKGAIWHPTLIFEKLLSYEKMGGYGGTGTYSFWYFGDHQMYYSEEVELKLFCNYDFTDFPFDSHVCKINWGDDEQGKEMIQLNPAIVRYASQLTSVDTDPIVIKNLPYPFKFTLRSIPSFDKVYDTNYSYTGMTLTLERNSFGLLLSGYYYPTGSFALLSLISFVIHVDVVINKLPNNLFKREFDKRFFDANRFLGEWE